MTIEDCTFSGNTANDDGGGAYVLTYSGTVSLTNNTFSDNAAVNRGGGAYVYTESGTASLTNNTFNDNGAGYGGGAYVYTESGTASLTNNTFSDNDAGYGGGARVSVETGTVSLTNNTFSDNYANNGGGADVFAETGPASLTNNTFYSNTATNYGGGFYGFLESNSATLQVYNNIIYQNTASAGGNDGDDVYVLSDGNHDTTGSFVELFNNDLSGNAVFDEASDPNPGNGILESEDLYISDTDNYTYGVNIQSDPLFVDPANGDFHLQSTSPCIDVGENSAPSIPTTDFEGDPRIINGTVDMGADEYRAASVVTSVPTMNEWGLVFFAVLAG
ncbi:MAG: DUF5123 domain-containing protein, partial [Nitrospirae bacterium]